MYFVNSWVLGWSSDPWDWNEVCTLLHIIMYYYISTCSTHQEGSIVVSRCVNDITSVEVFSQLINGTNSQRHHYFCEKGWKMQLLSVHIPAHHLKVPHLNFHDLGWGAAALSCLVMTCLAKHAPLENLRSCDRMQSLSPSCADGCLAGDVYLDISLVGICCSLLAGISYCWKLHHL